jgi:hypothetical protein
MGGVYRGWYRLLHADLLYSRNAESVLKQCLWPGEKQGKIKEFNITTT